MATLVDHKHIAVTIGRTDDLIKVMIAAQMKASRFNASNRKRHAESVVRAAIRRGGRTDAHHELRLSEAEMDRWLADNPVPLS